MCQGLVITSQLIRMHDYWFYVRSNSWSDYLLILGVLVGVTYFCFITNQGGVLLSWPRLVRRTGQSTENRTSAVKQVET